MLLGAKWYNMVVSALVFMSTRSNSLSTLLFSECKSGRRTLTFMFISIRFSPYSDCLALFFGAEHMEMGILMLADSNVM